MQLSCDPHTFLLLRINQPATDGGKSLLRELTFSNVYTRSDVSRKRTVWLKTRHTSVEDPAIISFFTPQPILHGKWLMPIKRLRVGIQTCLQICRMDALQPPVSQFCFKGSAGDVQPGLINVGAQLVGI